MLEVIGTPAAAGPGAQGPPFAVTPEGLPPGVRIATVAGPLTAVTAMAFLPDGSLLVTEKPGWLRMITPDGRLLSEHLLELPTNFVAERGLLGVAPHPRFTENGYVFLYHTLDAETPVDRIVRVKLTGSSVSEVTPAFTVADAAAIHHGGQLVVGLDGMLYLGVGEGDVRERAGQLAERRGKILRFDPDTLPLAPPADNPYRHFPGVDPFIWARGLRNPFGLAVDPLNSRPKAALWATENGPDCNDELDHILPGRDYGWGPAYACTRPGGTGGQSAPEWVWPTTISPTGADFYAGAGIPEWTGSLLVCSYNEGRVFRATLDGARDHVTRMAIVYGLQCQIDVATSPDGWPYFVDGGGYETAYIRRLEADPDATPGPRPTPTTAPRFDLFLPGAWRKATVRR